MSVSREEYELCVVCGDKALGYNFDAITCVSCKAFFRRNATKTEEYKCFLGGGCKIDVTTRTTCKRCRLDKCFDMGMTTKLILNEEQKKWRNSIIRENRRRKERIVATVGHSSRMSIESDGNDSMDFLEIENYNREEINKEILKIQNYISDNNMNDISETVFQTALEFELSVLPIDRPITDYRNNFNEFESNKWTELSGAVTLLHSPLAKFSTIVYSYWDSLHILRLKCEEDLKKIIAMTKLLDGFKNVYERDQIILLKYTSFEIYKLQSIKYFNFNGHYWNIALEEENKSVIVKLDTMKEGNNDIQFLCSEFMRKLGQEWDSDAIIIDLLSLILLYNPNLPNLMDRDAIKLQQHIYMYLLQRYLLLRYRTEAEAKAKFLRLLNCLTELHVMNEKIAAFCKLNDGSHKPPLFREICDRQGL